MSKILVVGDLHGVTSDACAAVDIADANECDVIYQVGDFGVWPGKSGIKYLDDLNTALLDSDLHLYFTEGNHEDYTQLLAHIKDESDYQKTHSLRSNIHWMPRSYVWEYGGLRFMALGGAASIDRDARKAYVDWWPEEQIKESDVIRCLSVDGPIDVLLTHDMAMEAEHIFPWMHPVGAYCRKAISVVVQEKKPALHINGHMHKMYENTHPGHYNLGLDHGRHLSAAIAVLNTEERTVTTVAFGAKKF